jgi:hypothetical protein
MLYDYLSLKDETEVICGQKRRTVEVIGKTSCGGCCTHESTLNVIEINIWIGELQKAIKEAQKYRAALQRHQARRNAELDKIEAERLAYQKAYT